ncbi:pantothenate kinase [Anabaena sp. FACHB-1237]|uniref:pantothenate kinase n=1 Tax=Anabaena sp. FACHB-1237 TaxID=2692769 RepID=UPI0016805652|nr:pantothenate kinase [Anabaena sp. FACHB-1237]MBD2137880.1 pantothenate kinase [Anabaena sp. FACHB-1237]
MENHKNYQYQSYPWLGLIIGNSRLHWGLFMNHTLSATVDTPHLPLSIITNLTTSPTLDNFLQILSLDIPDHSGSISSPLPIIIASVVPTQTALWQKYPHHCILTLQQIPIGGMYPTFGIDRALAIYSAGEIYEYPTLVIDAGTALTFTGVDAQKTLVGGAILPGVKLQFNSLAQNTGQLSLPQNSLNEYLPLRFALNTPEAIKSGIIYTLLSSIKDFILAWWELFPETTVVITGGDSNLLYSYLEKQFPEIAVKIIVHSNLLFSGIAKIISFAY